MLISTLTQRKKKEEAKKLDEENKDMFTFMQEAIADKVKDCPSFKEA